MDEDTTMNELPAQSKSFLDEFLEEHPQNHLFSECSLSLRDWITAFKNIKNVGDFTHLYGPFNTQYQGFLFKSWADRMDNHMKCEN